MRVLLSSIAILLLPLSLAYAQDDARYQACTRLATDNPAAALKSAQDWVLAENTPSAQHCKAIALFGLRRYRESAAELQRLAIRLERSDRLLWANVMHQAARAWELSGNSTRALATLDYAVSGLDDDAHSNHSYAQRLAAMLLKRSEIYQKQGDALSAVQDLDYGVSLAPNDDNLRLARAELMIEMHEPALAKADIEAVLQRNPRNAEAAALKRKLK